MLREGSSTHYLLKDIKWELPCVKNKLLSKLVFPHRRLETCNSRIPVLCNVTAKSVTSGQWEQIRFYTDDIVVKGISTATEHGQMKANE